MRYIVSRFTQMPPMAAMSMPVNSDSVMRLVMSLSMFGPMMVSTAPAAANSSATAMGSFSLPL